MGVLKAIGLGILQGLTEFLPVSSSGHLVLAQQLFPSGVESPLAFDVVVHVGTLLSVLAYFRKDLGAMIRSSIPGAAPPEDYLGRWVWLLALATLPIVAVAVAFSDAVDAAFHSTVAVGPALWLTASALVIASRLSPGTRGGAALTWRDAVIIGLFQAMAVVPGVSRSGLTIVGGLLAGLERETAARFAFLLSVPAIIGATLFNIDSIGALYAEEAAALVAGLLAAAITGWIAIEVMMRAVRVGRLVPFALYCFVVGGLTLLVGAL